jgi:hypothetical protein
MKLKVLATYWELTIESGKIFKFFFFFPKFGVLKRVKFRHFENLLPFDDNLPEINIEPNWWVFFF